MAKQVATTKQTGGGGFNFEDKVTAYFMSHLLSGCPSLDPNFGTIKKINLQTRVDGWLLDDTLLILDDGRIERLCAFSVKSNRQFSKTSAPADFVKDAWELYLGDASNVFNKDTDRIGIITAPLDTETKTKLEDLLKKSRCQEHAELYERVGEKDYISDEERSIFESFACPEELAIKHSIDKTLTGKLLNCIEHLDFDFEQTSSSKKNHAISILRSVLVNSSNNKAIDLWNSLCTIARKTRADGGYIDLNILVAKLRKHYHLKDFPDYVPIWNEINRKTRNELALISDKIAGTVSIDRSDEIADINKKLEEHQVVVLLGESGCGKTVIEKNIVETNQGTSKIIWINPETITLLDDLPISGPIKAITDKTALVIIDGADRFHDNIHFKKIAILLKECLKGSEESPWKTIISCQPDEWARVQYNLSKLSCIPNYETIIIQNPSNEALALVWEKFPPLRKLSLYRHLQSFLFKPKVLDLFASKIKNIDSAKAFSEAFECNSKIGESHLIKWFWECEIEQKYNGLQKSKLLKRIAEELADKLICKSQVPPGQSVALRH